MHEGRTGASTINIVSRRERGHDATEEEIKAIYQAKTEEFNKCPKARTNARTALEVLTKIKKRRTDSDGSDRFGTNFVIRPVKS